MINRIKKFILSIINLFFLDKNEKNFINHNKTLFNYKSKNSNNEILIEHNKMRSNYIAVSYVSNILSKIHDAELIGYQPHIKFGLFNKFKRYLTELKVRKIYKSFGVNKTLKHNIDKYRVLANHLTEKLFSEINSKSDLVNLIIDDISIGDLIYDQYLAKYHEPTPKIKSEKLRKILFDFCILYYYWFDYFSYKNVKALIVGHACYFDGVSARIAISFNIPVYQVNLQNVYYLSKQNLFPSSEFHSYKKDFEKLSLKKKNDAIVTARERIKLIFEGKIGVDQPYIKNSAYTQKKTRSKIINGNKEVKILIASHSFYDSPNGVGKTLFPDFYEWLEFIGKLSNETDYEWYIKTHPGIGIYDTETINSFVSRYKKIKLVPNLTSHHQLIEEGINIVLTVYGSIGLEYAAKNITVINASLNTPHIAYDFNIHPKSKEELKNIVLNLEDYKNLNLYSDDVYRCYFMKYLYHNHNIFFQDFKHIEKQIGGYDNLNSSKIFDYWIKDLNPNIHDKIKQNINSFIFSKEYKIISSWN